MTFAEANQAVETARIAFAAACPRSGSYAERTVMVRAAFAAMAELSKAQEVVRTWDHSVQRWAEAA